MFGQFCPQVSGDLVNGLDGVTSKLKEKEMFLAMLDSVCEPTEICAGILGTVERHDCVV